jgi:transcriptional regulator with XRE-family HTH domain
MKLRGESALSLGEKLQLAHTTVGRWLHGAEPRAEQIEKLANALSVSAQWLLTGKGPGPDEIVREDEGDYGRLGEKVLQIVRRGPPGAVPAFNDEELLDRIREQVEQMNKDRSFMRGAHGEIIMEFAAELYRRLKNKPEEK